MKTDMHDDAELWATTAAAGGLNATELKAWRDHAATCHDCQKLYEEEMTMNKLVKDAIHAESPDAGFERRMISKFRRDRARKAIWWHELLEPVPMLIGGVAACVALALFFGAGAVTIAEKPVVARATAPESALQALPTEVRQTIQSNAEGRTVTKVTPTKEDGEAVYDIATQSKDGEEWEMTVAVDGTLLSADVAVAELPVAVQRAIQSQAGHGVVEGVEKLIDDGETTYRAGITASQGDQRDFTYAASGTLLSQEVGLAELPAAVQTTITAQVGQGKLEGIDKTYDDGDVTYEATMVTPAGEERNFSVSSEGAPLSREVSFEDVPATVKAAIAQTLGPGKVVEIDQSFAAENPATQYEIESEKDGKAFDFAISPTGRFLGMEE